MKYFIFCEGDGYCFCKGYRRYDEARAAYEALAWSFAYASRGYTHIVLTTAGERIISEVTL